MASVRVMRRARRADSDGTAAGARRAAPRREEVEDRVRSLACEETRLAREGFYEGAQAAARERRYWEFLRALLDAPLGRPAARGSVH
jgi:hypothetical protein